MKVLIEENVSLGHFWLLRFPSGPYEHEQEYDKDEQKDSNEIHVIRYYYGLEKRMDKYTWDFCWNRVLVASQHMIIPYT